MRFLSTTAAGTVSLVVIFCLSSLATAWPLSSTPNTPNSDVIFTQGIKIDPPKPVPGCSRMSKEGVKKGESWYGVKCTGTTTVCRCYGLRCANPHNPGVPTYKNVRCVAEPH